MQTDFILDLKVKSATILCVSIKNMIKKLLSSKIASFYGGTNGFSLKPTSARRLLLLTIYTICSGAPKSLDCLSSKGSTEYILKPLLVAKAIHEWSPLNLIPLIMLSKDEDLPYIGLLKFWNFVIKPKLFVFTLLIFRWIVKIMLSNKNTCKSFYCLFLLYFSELITFS